MDISLATRNTPKSAQAAVEKPWLKPYQGTSTAAAKKVNENRTIFVQIRGAPVVAEDAELGVVGLGGMAVGGSTGWPVKPVKHSTVPCPAGNSGRRFERQPTSASRYLSVRTFDMSSLGRTGPCRALVRGRTGAMVPPALGARPTPACRHARVARAGLPREARARLRPPEPWTGRAIPGHTASQSGRSPRTFSSMR